MPSTILQFFSEMLAFAGCILLLWCCFQLASFVWSRCTRLRRQAQIEEYLEEITVADRRVWQREG